jgi:excisionase family DNA binding protein
MKLQDAAQRLGVHYQTAYRWVRDGSLPATKIGRGYDVTEEDVRRFEAARSAGQPPEPAVRVRDWKDQAERLFAALAAGDERQARRQVERLFAGHVSVVDLCTRLLAPAMERVGREWAANRLSVAEEHRASAICERLLAPLAQPGPGRPRGIAVVSTPPGERHGLPALMAAAALREERWVVHHLAADLPLAALADLAEQVSAGLIVLSRATPAGDTDGEDVRALQDRLPEVQVLVGRPGADLHDLLAAVR